MGFKRPFGEEEGWYLEILCGQSKAERCDQKGGIPTASYRHVSNLMADRVTSQRCIFDQGTGKRS
jgi:hypothetical protein